MANLRGMPPLKHFVHVACLIFLAPILFVCLDDVIFAEWYNGLINTTFSPRISEPNASSTNTTNAAYIGNVSSNFVKAGWEKEKRFQATNEVPASVVTLPSYRLRNASIDLADERRAEWDEVCMKRL